MFWRLLGIVLILIGLIGIGVALYLGKNRG
jgi:hypothetical protein